METVAKRISGFDELDTSSMCYWKSAEGDWLLYVPKCGLGNLRLHEVSENEDGTISVVPSILITGHDDGEQVKVHGFLTDGVWRDC